jgi:hypothetical protein
VVFDAVTGTWERKEKTVASKRKIKRRGVQIKASGRCEILS